MLTEAFRRTDEYKALYNAVLAVAPDLPQVLVEQAIWLHRTDPTLYKKLIKLEKEEARKAAKKKQDAVVDQPVDDDTPTAT